MTLSLFIAVSLFAQALFGKLTLGRLAIKLFVLKQYLRDSYILQRKITALQGFVIKHSEVDSPTIPLGPDLLSFYFLSVPQTI